MGKRVLTLFGTRPELIKLAPVVCQLESRPAEFTTVNVASAQHTDLLYPFARFFGVRIDHDLGVMRPRQTPTDVCARVLSSLDPLLAREQPDMVLVQGDTTTTLAGALAAFHRRIPVGHVEAGLRSGSPASPFPEEMNRRLISRLATYHFAPTSRNRDTLVREGVSPERVFVTGNPVVDALQAVLARGSASLTLRRVFDATDGLRMIVLTTHRRESLGRTMRDNLRALARFVDRHDDVALVFPVHPNPSVVAAAADTLGDRARVFLTAPLNYPEFVALLTRAWLIVSDSGGVQEEAPTLRKPLLVLRDTTERPEAIECGIARLVPDGPRRLEAALEEAYRRPSWVDRLADVENPFGSGDSGARIVGVLAAILGAPARHAAAGRGRP
jgi:UDP-N-acetylglucosamine 2-epimerase (non-hydrolysing)